MFIKLFFKINFSITFYCNINIQVFRSLGLPCMSRGNLPYSYYSRLPNRKNTWKETTSKYKAQLKDLGRGGQPTIQNIESWNSFCVDLLENTCIYSKEIYSWIIYLACCSFVWFKMAQQLLPIRFQEHLQVFVLPKH